MQAYVQARLEGKETWVLLPDECIENDAEHRHLFYDKQGNRLFEKPCVRLVNALYGHPDAGSCWERHCDARMKAGGVPSHWQLAQFILSSGLKIETHEDMILILNLLFISK